MSEEERSLRLPPNARAYLEALLGRTRPVEDPSYFSPDELSVLRELAARANNGAVTYDVYQQLRREADGNRDLKDLLYFGEEDSEFADALLGLADRSSSPMNNLMTTLGQFRVEPTETGYRILDRYNFNVGSESRPEAFREGIGALVDNKDVYKALRLFGEAFGPRGSFSGDDSAGFAFDFEVPR